MTEQKTEFYSIALAVMEKRFRRFDTRLAEIGKPTLVERFFYLWLYWISCLSFSSPDDKTEVGRYDYYDPYHHQKRAAAGGECFIAAIPLMLFSIWLMYLCALWTWLLVPLVIYALYVVRYLYGREQYLVRFERDLFQKANEEELGLFNALVKDENSYADNFSLVKVRLSGTLLSNKRCFEKVTAIVVISSNDEKRDVLLTLVEIDGNGLPEIDEQWNKLIKLASSIDEIDERFLQVLDYDANTEKLTHLYARGSRVRVASKDYKFWREGTLQDKTSKGKEDAWTIVYDNFSSEDVLQRRLIPLFSASEYGFRRLLSPLIHLSVFVFMVVIGIGTFAYPLQPQGSTVTQRSIFLPLTEQPREGALVLARFKKGSFAFWGRAGRKVGDDEFEIDYLDGDKEVLALKDLFFPTISNGQRVQYAGVVDGKHGWLEGKFLEMTEREMTVQSRDGSVVTVELVNVRLRLP